MFGCWRVLVLGTTLFSSSVVWAGQAQFPPCRPSGAEATLAGTVSDSSGARITSATVQVGCGTEVQRAHTDASGQFQFRVPQGEYGLRVEAAGFVAYSKALHVTSAAATSDVTLEIRSASATVNVTAEAGYVANDSTTATKSDTPILETPQSISVVTRAEMDARLSTKRCAMCRAWWRNRKATRRRSGIQAVCN
jgi:iron complex outermembrane recepter protein